MKNYFRIENKKQKITITTGLFFIIIIVSVWAFQGFHLFTHDKIMKKLPQTVIEKMLGQPPRFTWINHFTLGLEYTLAVTVVVIILCTLFFFLFRTINVINNENINQ